MARVLATLIKQEKKAGKKWGVHVTDGEDDVKKSSKLKDSECRCQASLIDQSHMRDVCVCARPTSRYVYA